MRSIRILATSVLIATLAVLALSGCHSKGSEGGAPIVLGFSQSGVDNVWRAANSESIKLAAAADGIQLKFIDSPPDQPGHG